MTLRTVLVAATTLSAGLVHLAAGPAHAASPAWYWGGFVVIGLAQVVAAVLALVRGRLAPAVVVNLGAIGIWALSNSVGLPGGVGGHAIGVADAVTVGLQVAAVLGAALPVGRASAPHPQLLSVAPVVLLALGLGGISIADLRSHDHDHGDAHVGSEDHDHGTAQDHDHVHGGHADRDGRADGGRSGPDAGHAHEQDAGHAHPDDEGHAHADDEEHVHADDGAHAHADDEEHVH